MPVGSLPKALNDYEQVIVYSDEIATVDVVSQNMPENVMRPGAGCS
jgi:cell wall assembly regulator SMI1